MDQVNDILGALGPHSGPLIWNLVLYGMFVLNLILLFVEGSTFGTNLVMAVLLFIFIDKTYAFGHMFSGDKWTDPETCHTKVFFGTYLIRVAMFAGPFSIAGSTEKGAARALAIVTGLAGIVYMFGRWFTEQREFEATSVTCMADSTDPTVMVQTLGLGLVLAKIALRDRFRLGAIDRHIPIPVSRELAAHELEE